LFIAVFAVSTSCWNFTVFLFISEARTAMVPKILAFTIAEMSMKKDTIAIYPLVEYCCITSFAVLGATSFSPKIMTEWYIIEKYFL